MQHTTLAALLLWASGFTLAVAGISAPSSHATVSVDGKRVLVMVSPVAAYDRNHPVRFALPDGRSVILHEAFAKTGCYDATTLAPIWQAEWYLPPHNEDWRASPDFSDVALLNRFGLDSDWALAFYHEGRPMHRYGCQQLMTRLRSKLFLPYATWDWHHQWHEDFELEGDRLTVSTARRRVNLWNHEFNLGLQESYTFNITTGEMLDQKVEGAWLITAYGVFLVFVLLLIPLAFWCRRRSQHGRNASYEHTP